MMGTSHKAPVLCHIHLRLLH